MSSAIAAALLLVAAHAPQAASELATPAPLASIGLAPQKPAASAGKARACEELVLAHAAQGFSGSVLVAWGGKTVFEGGVGFADFDANVANGPDTLFEIASITKPFTATAVLVLAGQEKLALDDSIASRLPGVPEHSRAITLRQLLAHTSGIPRGNAAGRGEDLARAVSEYLGTGPTAAPGSRHEYWNGGYALLAGVIETASGERYEDFLRREIFVPAGMSSSCFTGETPAESARDAWGISAQGRPRRATEHPYGSYGYQYRGMGGLVTSVRDLARFDRALAAGKILSAELQREMFAPQKSDYALGWRIGRAQDGGLRQSHGGGVRAFVSEFRRYPDADGAIAVLANRDDYNPGEIADQLEALLCNRPLVREPTAPILEGRVAAARAGEFTCRDGRLSIRAAPGVLWAGVEGEALIDALGANESLTWAADRRALGELSTRAIDALARGDAEPIRRAMAKRIPARWPDDLRDTLWPRMIARHGPMTGLRLAGTRARGGRLEVLVELAHAAGPSQVQLAFDAEGLQYLDLEGPAFLLEARLASAGGAAMELLVGESPPKLVFEFSAGKVPALRAASRRLVRG